LSWIVRLPAPFGFGLDENRVRVLETKELSGISADQDCIVPHAFDPYDLLPTLARLGPRGIEVIVLKNELRFLGEKFLRTKQMFPGHPSGEKILRPLYDRVESLPEIHRPELPRGTATLFSDSEFEIVARMFSEGLSGAAYETVLGDDIDRSTTCSPDEELEACLVRLEGNRAVYLEKDRRFTFINQQDALVRGRIDQLEAGDRLILIKPEAREDIADRVLGARREEESTTPAQEVIASWRDELRQGIERLDLTNPEILRRIQAIGSKITSASAIAQWCDGRVLGPQDAHDIRRIGEVLQSTWLAENWKRVGAALFMIRTGHRVLGQRVSRIIEAAALGEYTLSSEDEEFLEGIGVAFLQLQDAVVDVTVEGISDQSRKVPAYQIGTVISV
jgi:hypothetical protein